MEIKGICKRYRRAPYPVRRSIRLGFVCQIGLYLTAGLYALLLSLIHILPQKIHVKGDETKPVLLFLHGGPGVCNRHTVMTVHADLQKDFLVVAWDQRGSGGSYRGAAVETLTIDRLVDDAHELVLWLCREYGRKKVYLLGGSWGSELGTWLAYRYPCLLYTSRCV